VGRGHTGGRSSFPKASENTHGVDRLNICMYVCRPTGITLFRMFVFFVVRIKCQFIYKGY
jgi:hypothetical protein